MKVRSSKNKGRRLQNLVRDVLRDLFNSFLDPEDIKSQTMGMPGEDIVLSPAAQKVIPYSFECKNVERLDLWGSLEQASTNSQDRKPVLIIKRNRSKVYAILELDDFKELIKPDEQ